MSKLVNTQRNYHKWVPELPIGSKVTLVTTKDPNTDRIIDYGLTVGAVYTIARVYTSTFYYSLEECPGRQLDGSMIKPVAGKRR